MFGFCNEKEVTGIRRLIIVVESQLIFPNVSEDSD